MNCTFAAHKNLSMRFLFLLIFTVSVFQAKAQIVKNEQKIGWRGGTENVKLNSFPNKDRSLNCVFLSSPEYLKGFVYDSKLEVKHSFNYFNLPNQNIIGGFFGDTTLTVILKSNNLGDFRSLIFSLKNDSLIANQVLTTYIDDKNYVGGMNAGDDFYCISSGKKIPFLSVSNFKTQSKISENIYELNKGLNTNLTDREMYKALTEANGAFNRITNIAFIDEFVKPSADEAKFKNKMYLRNDSLILTTDDKFSETKLFTLKLNSNFCTYKNIKFPFFNPSTATELYNNSNSSIVENTLYHLYANSDHLQLCAFNLGINDTLANYLVYQEQEINFKNTDILQEGTAISRKETKILKTNQFLRKISNGNAIISGTKNQNGLHEITVGAYRITENNNYTPMVMGGGLLGVAIAGGVAAALGTNKSWTMVSRFKSLFDPTTSKHIPGEITETGSDLIDDYVKDVKMPSQGSDTFYSDGNTYYTYYDNDLKSLITIQLK